MSVVDVAWPLLSVAILWGMSNPLMKRGSRGITSIKKTGSPCKDFFLEYYFLFTQPLYVAAFLVNIAGSVLYYYSLGNSDISLIETITNSLTFLITTLTSQLLGEEGITKYTYVGMALVLAGVSVCISSKVQDVQAS